MKAIERGVYSPPAILQSTAINTQRTIALLVGILFIIGTIAGVLTVVFIQPVFDDPNYLVTIAANGKPIIIASFFMLIMGLSLACVPILLFPVLKHHNETLALGYIVFRGALETMTYIAGAVGWMLLLPVSQASIQAGAPDASIFQVLGTVLRKEAEISSTMTAIVFPLGAIMFYTVLYQSNLIPRWISVWGLIGVVLHLLAIGIGGMFTLTSGLVSLQVLFALPILVQEMVMAGWLIVKGFNQSAIASRLQ